MSETVRDTDIVWMDLHTPYSTVSWVSKISNDKKRRAVSLRQLSFLLYTVILIV